LGSEDDDGSREQANYGHIEPSHDRPSLMQSLEHIQFSTETGCALAAAGSTAAAGRVELPKLQNDKKVFSEAQSRLRSENCRCPN
jgi:hypothetical protein